MIANKMKGISQFVALILLIVAAVGIGGILMLYFSGYFRGVQQEIGGTTEKFQACSKGTLYVDISNVKIEPKRIEIPITNGISENLYNFSFVIYTSTNTYELKPQNQRTKDNPLKPGELETFILLPITTIEGKVEKIKVVANCLDMKIEREFNL